MTLNHHCCLLHAILAILIAYMHCDIPISECCSVCSVWQLPTLLLQQVSPIWQVFKSNIGLVAPDIAAAALPRSHTEHALVLLQSRGPSQGPGSEIANIAWNRKVQHILASCTVGGSVTVWDLKKQQPVLNIRDSSG